MSRVRNVPERRDCFLVTARRAVMAEVQLAQLRDTCRYDPGQSTGDVGEHAEHGFTEQLEGTERRKTDQPGQKRIFNRSGALAAVNKTPSGAKTQAQINGSHSIRTAGHRELLDQLKCSLSVEKNLAVGCFIQHPMFCIKVNGSASLLATSRRESAGFMRSLAGKGARWRYGWGPQLRPALRCPAPLSCQP